MSTNWDELQDLTQYTGEILEPWMEGEEGGTWEWEEVYEDNSLVGKRKKRKNP